MERDEFRLLILGWNGGQLGGEEVLAWARRALRTGFPMMFLTARQSKEDVA
jgi:DNA-binding response OmpR family regulator